MCHKFYYTYYTYILIRSLRDTVIVIKKYGNRECKPCFSTRQYSRYILSVKKFN